jgi:sulfur-oxidizing protein SoxA
MEGWDKKAGTAAQVPESMDYCNPEYFMSHLSTGIRINVPGYRPSSKPPGDTFPLELLP